MANKCEQCGVCCKLFAINLNATEYHSHQYETIFPYSKDFDKFSDISKYGLNLVAQKSDGSCIYLENNFCKIHLTRPQVCRKFFCGSKNKQFVQMQQIIKKHKKHSV
ncbi:MAG: YkgJ family cysteine cluster protein [bacterium]